MGLGRSWAGEAKKMAQTSSPWGVTPYFFK
jgi:hypothetical protein